MIPSDALIWFRFLANRCVTLLAGHDLRKSLFPLAHHRSVRSLAELPPRTKLFCTDAGCNRPGLSDFLGDHVALCFS